MFLQAHPTVRIVLVLLGGGLCLAPAALAVDNSYVPAAGGVWSAAGNWSLGHCPLANEHVKILVSGTANKAVTYDWSGMSTFGSVTVDGNGALYGAIWQLDHVLTTYDMYLGRNGPGWHWMEGPSYLWVNDNLYVGYLDSGPGHFYMSTLNDYSAGLQVGDMCYVGYMAPGDFDHTSGIAQMYRLYVGQNDPGTYWMRGGRLELETQFLVGNGSTGTFEQTGGAVAQSGTDGLIMGLNTGGEGWYLMKGGEVDVDHVALAWNGDAYFTQSGGTVTTVGDIYIGCQGTHPMQAWYKLNEDDGTAVLNVGGDMLVGPQTLGKYEQAAGTCNIGGNLEIWQGSPTSSSHVYLGTSAGLLDVGGEVINHTGYYDQDGGVMTTSDFTNDSTQGVNIDNSADFRATHLTNNAGTFRMWRNAIVRGELAIPPSTYWLCNFTNNATLQMGSGAANGGSFRGILTNYGTFDYTQGDFATSSLINHGTVNLNADFTCRRWVNNTDYTVPADRHITADGAGYANAFENNSSLSMAARSWLSVGSKKLVNNGALCAGAPGSDAAHIYGDLDTNGFVLPSLASLNTGHLYVHGAFTSTAGALLRTRIRGTGTNDRDHVTVSGTANLGGTLDVYLTGGFVPVVGNTFSLVKYGARSGQFNAVNLPTLPSGMQWQLDYTSLEVRLTVIAAPVRCPGDSNCDGEVDFADIDLFVGAIPDAEAAWAALFEARYGHVPTCPFLNNDCTGDGHVNFADIDPFVALIPSVCP